VVEDGDLGAFAREENGYGAAVAYGGLFIDGFALAAAYDEDFAVGEAVGGGGGAEGFGEDGKCWVDLEVFGGHCGGRGVGEVEWRGWGQLRGRYRLGVMMEIRG
jgi:hypothetical protein